MGFDLTLSIGCHPPRLYLDHPHDVLDVEWEAEPEGSGWVFGETPVPRDLEYGEHKALRLHWLRPAIKALAEAHDQTILNLIEQEGMDEDEVRDSFKESWAGVVSERPDLRYDAPAKAEAFSAHIDDLHRSRKITGHRVDSVTMRG